MSGFKPTTGQAWPNITNDRLIDNDPMIVKVPMDEVDWGAGSKMMGRAKQPLSGGNGKLYIKHVEGKKE